MSQIASRPSRIPLMQGIFYVATGLWPIVHLRSFELVAGPKRDRWLVKTMGGLIAAVGAALVVAGLEKTRSRSLSVLGVASAFALGAADVIYVAKRRIPPVYLADAAAEAALCGAWFVSDR